jgi:hypothetical protein
MGAVELGDKYHDITLKLIKLEAVTFLHRAFDWGLKCYQKGVQHVVEGNSPLCIMPG